ncbi:MAG: hypothetical protein R2766_02630 [Saprospiraceae bacterium]
MMIPVFRDGLAQMVKYSTFNVMTEINYSENGLTPIVNNVAAHNEVRFHLGSGLSKSGKAGIFFRHLQKDM